jgi:hypothetical protein
MKKIKEIIHDFMTDPFYYTLIFLSILMFSTLIGFFIANLIELFN